ncbi:hypothetical protein VTI28DRAFT_2257 [Corynascus sepedonium]
MYVANMLIAVLAAFPGLAFAAPSGNPGGAALLKRDYNISPHGKTYVAPYGKYKYDKKPYYSGKDDSDDEKSSDEEDNGYKKYRGILRYIHGDSDSEGERHKGYRYAVSEAEDNSRYKRRDLFDGLFGEEEEEEKGDKKDKQKKKPSESSDEEKALQ